MNAAQKYTDARLKYLAAARWWKRTKSTTAKAALIAASEAMHNASEELKREQQIKGAKEK